MQPTPDIASDMAKTFVKGVYAVDGRMISIVTLDSVLPISAKAAA
jgi:purine-binding chemotaxis protein CheW